MIKFDGFALAIPRRAAAGWMLNAFIQAGAVARVYYEPIYQPPNIGFGGYVLGCVRHPYRWLRSYFDSVIELTGVPEIDVFMGDKEESKGNFVEFIGLATGRHAGGVGRMFGVYRTSTVVRTEDLPWAAVEFLESVGAPRPRSVVSLRPSHATIRRMDDPKIDAELRRQVFRAESEFCEQYEYW